jgi:hypothetical protein
MGQAIQQASDPMFDGSINANQYEGVYKIFDLASNGEEFRSSVLLPRALPAAMTALDLPGSEKISAINSISTTQVEFSVLPAIIALPKNNNNPGGNRGFMLTDLVFEPTTAPNYYDSALSTKFCRELGCSVTTPEPSALWALFGLSLVPLVKRVKKSIG